MSGPGFPGHEDDCHCHEAVRLFGYAASQPPSGHSDGCAGNCGTTYDNPPCPAADRASQPPSGDAPDLREALIRDLDSEMAGTEDWIEGTDDYLELRIGLVRRLRAALAASAPSSPATPAPLDVERPDLLRDMAAALYETDPPESWMRTGTDEYRKRAAAMLAILERERRAYANQEGGEPRKENADD